MKVDIMNKEGMVLLSRNSGETLRVSLPEFWEIVKAGDRLDVRQEIDNYLADGGEFEGVDADNIRDNQGFLEEVIDKVIDIRIGNENGNQIYDAICHCVKHGKNKDGLFEEKSLADMDVADFKDPEWRKEFNGLEHAYRDLTRRIHEQNGMPFGGDRNMQDFLRERRSDVTTKMDLLRVKQWVAQQKDYTLDTKSPLYREAIDMMEGICRWTFPELAEMIFDGSDEDLIFREPGEVVAYDWFYYNPDATAGGQLVFMPFTEEEGRRMFGHPDPISVVGDNCMLEDIDKKGFFITMFDMLQMKEDGWFVGTDIQEVCQDIFVEHCKKNGHVMVDSVKQSVWHGDVDVPFGFPGLDEIGNGMIDSAAPILLRNRLESVGLFEDICVERIGFYKNGVGYSFSFTANVDERIAGDLLQKALDGLNFEAASEIKRVNRVEGLIHNAKARTAAAVDNEKIEVEMGI